MGIRDSLREALADIKGQLDNSARLESVPEAQAVIERSVERKLGELRDQYGAKALIAERDIVFGDHHENHYYHQAFNIVLQAAPDHSLVLDRYKRILRDRPHPLNLPPLDSHYADMSEQKEAPTLHDVFVYLQTWPVDERRLCEEKKAEAPEIRESAPEERKPQLLTEAVGEHELAVILGKPGSGKTTFVCRLMLPLLDGQPLQGWPEETMGYVSVHVELRWFAQWLKGKASCDAGQLWAHIETKLEEESLGNAVPELRKQADKHQLLFMLDGLDEVLRPDQPGLSGCAEIHRQQSRQPLCPYLPHFALGGTRVASAGWSAIARNTRFRK